MGRVKDLWMDWQEEQATEEQLELSLEEQLQLANEWIQGRLEGKKYE